MHIHHPYEGPPKPKDPTQPRGAPRPAGDRSHLRIAGSAPSGWALPTIPSITSLRAQVSINSPNKRTVYPGWLLSLLASAPSVKRLSLRLLDSTEPDPPLELPPPSNYVSSCLLGAALLSRRTNSIANTDLSPALESLVSANLQHLTLDFSSKDFCNPTYYWRVQHNPGSTHEGVPDALNTSLRQISYQLRSLRVLGNFQVGTDLFVPRIGATTEQTWPYLEELVVCAHVVACDGRWLFPALAKFPKSTRHPRDFTKNTFTKPAPGPFNELVCAMSKAMLQMRSLKTLWLVFSTTVGGMEFPGSRWDRDSVRIPSKHVDGLSFLYHRRDWVPLKGELYGQSYDVFGPIPAKYQGKCGWKVPRKALDNWVALRRGVEGSALWSA